MLKILTNKVYQYVHIKLRLDFVTCNKMFHRDGDSNNYDGLQIGDFRNKWLRLADRNAHADVGLGQSKSCCQKLGKNWKK